MQTITLKVEDSINDKFIWLLSHFSKIEIEILDKTTYQSDDEYLRSIKVWKIVSLKPQMNH